MTKISETMTQYANRSIMRRRLEEQPNLQQGILRLDAFKLEGKVLREALGIQDFREIMDYVASNSSYIKTSNELIHIVWAQDKFICIHRLLAKDLLQNHQANWLGVWVEPLVMPKETVSELMKKKLRLRKKMQAMRTINQELQIVNAL